MDLNLTDLANNKLSLLIIRQNGFTCVLKCSGRVTFVDCAVFGGPTSVGFISGNPNAIAETPSTGVTYL